MKVPFFDFGEAPLGLKSAWANAMTQVISEGQFVGGRFVADFESAWAKYLNIEFAIGVANGFDALVLSLKALGIGAGARVAVPSHTFLATWLAVEAVGAKPVGIDVDDFGLIDLDLLERDHKNVDVVIAVHMHGRMVDMYRLTNWASSKNIKILEDCAQAHGATLQGKAAGTWGDVGAFSFYPTKNLGALGDAGIVVTHDKAIARVIRSLGSYGSIPDDKYNFERIGVNSRLDPIQAAVLLINLEYLDSWNLRRKEIAKRYLEALTPAGVKFLNTNIEESVWHHFVILSSHRDELKKKLSNLGIQTEIHYPASAQDSYSRLKGIHSLSRTRAREISEMSISLPLNPWLTETQIAYIVEALTAEYLLI